MDKIDQNIINQWRDLGFYYELVKNDDVSEWCIYGSKSGLYKFVQLLDNYINDPRNDLISEHEHHGPYWYFKIMTWTTPEITTDHIAGSITNSNELRELIDEKIHMIQTEQSFNIYSDYGINNSASLTFNIMDDDFDPASMDI